MRSPSFPPTYDTRIPLRSSAHSITGPRLQGRRRVHVPEARFLHLVHRQCLPGTVVAFPVNTFFLLTILEPTWKQSIDEFSQQRTSFRCTALEACCGETEFRGDSGRYRCISLSTGIDVREAIQGSPRHTRSGLDQACVVMYLKLHMSVFGYTIRVKTVNRSIKPRQAPQSYHHIH